MVLFVLAFAVNSCSTDDGKSSEEFLLPVESVIMPNSYALDNAATMMVSYRRPTDCHIFNGFFIDTEGKVSTIGIKALKFDQANCMIDDESLYEVPLKWTPTEAGNYTFKFWTGDNSVGEPQYIEHVITVEQ